MKITLISGIAENNLIGKRNELPWYLSEDLKRFKELTLGNTTIMGRKTYESIIARLGKPLPERTSIVITSNPNYEAKEGVIVVSSVKQAIEEAKKLGKDIFVIGGAQIYEQTIGLADRLEITRIYKNYEGDAFFPEIGKEWKEMKKEDKESKDGTKFSFITYEKIIDEDRNIIKMVNRANDVSDEDNVAQVSTERQSDNNLPINTDNSKMKNEGIFIAFEGIDGCGKSTQIRKLVQHIFEKNKHFHVILTREPYKDENIRKLLHEETDPYTKADKLADMYINDRKKHVEELIKPNLKKGNFILSDRYKFSTICYQSAQGLAMEDLINRHRELPIPDMTFIVDVSAEVARERMQKEDTSIRGKEHKFEANLDFARKLRENYLKSAEIMKSKGEKVFIINGERTPEEIFAEIKDIFDREVNKN